MFVRFRDHLRHHVIAYVALFIVLGGTAMALPGKGTVTSNDIAKKAVKSKNLAKHAVKSKNLAKHAVKSGNLADQAVTTTKLDDEAVTGAKADEASFQGLIQGDGKQSMTSVTVDGVGFLPTPIPLGVVPTMGQVELIGCFGAPNYSIRVRLLSSDDATPFFGAGTVTYSELPAGVGPPALSDQDAGMFSMGGGSPLIAVGPGGLGTGGHWDYSLSRVTGGETAGAHVSVDGYNDHAAPTAHCTVTATVETQT
jgi:hypothetical protein